MLETFDVLFTNLAASLSDGQSLILLSLFGTVLFLVLGAGAMVGSGRVSIARRLGGADGGARGSLRYDSGSMGLRAWMRRLDRSLAPQEDKKRTTVRRRLLQAGFYGPRSVTVYYVVRVSLAVALPLLTVGLLPHAFGSTDSQQLLVGAAGALAAGFFGPALAVSHRIRQRQTIVRVSFPDALDMLLVCVESGLGLTAAMGRVADEMGSAHPLIAEHFRMLQLEMQAGVTREKALRNMSERIGVEEVGSLTTLLNQAEQMGVSVSQTLRVYSSEMRKKRLTRAEEHANKIPVKMAAPLAGLILPSFIVVIMVPTIIRVMRELLPALAGN